MKKYLLMMALGLAVAGTSYAQDAPRKERAKNKTEQGRGDRGEARRKEGKREKLSPEQHATRRTEMLTKKLELNKSQEKKLQALNLKHAQKMQSLRGDVAKGGNRNDQQRQQMQSLRTEWEKDLKGILNNKQYAKYQEERKQMQAKRGDRKGKEDQGIQYKRSRNS